MSASPEEWRSPGTAPRRPAWLVWFEDIEGPGDKHVFFDRNEAGVRIAEILDLMMDEIDKEWRAAERQGGMDEYHEELRRLSEDVGRLTAAGDPWAALERWAEYEAEDEESALRWPGTVRVEEVTAG